LKVLDAHRSEQKKLREQFGSDYQTDLDLIFCQSDGSPLRPDSVSAAVSLLYKTLKLPTGSSLHAVRHAHASQLLAAGVPLPDVSKRLGHSNVFTTASVYAHSLPNADAEAARRWEEFQKQSEATPRPHQRKV
jgi:integrase